MSSPITVAQIEAVIDRVSEGESVNKICALDSKDRPCSQPAFYKFIANNEVFAEKYTLAMLIRMNISADVIEEIADNVEPTTEAIAKARLQIDTKKWLMAKQAPKKYGDKQTIAHTDPNGESLPELSQKERVARIAELLSKCGYTITRNEDATPE
jgi:hypothetical protein